MKLFSTDIYKDYVESISSSASIPISYIKLVTFGDSELKPVIRVEDAKDEHCVVFFPTSNPVNEHYMALFLMIDTLRRSGASKISVIMPYMGYSRQNQQHMTGEPVSAQVMVRILEMVGMSHMVTIDLHEEQLGGFFTVPLTHVSAYPILAQHIVAALVATKENDQSQATTRVAAARIVIVSPDQGGVERTRRFRDEIWKILKQVQNDDKKALPFIVDEQIAMLEKKRNLEGTHDVAPVEFSGADVADAIVIIPDDVIVSGSTIVNASIQAKEKGAKKVYLCASHADFIDGTVEKLKSAPVESIIVSDTIPIHDSWKFEKLYVATCQDLLSEAVKLL